MSGALVASGGFEVPPPILNTPFVEPTEYRNLREGEPPERNARPIPYCRNERRRSGRALRREGAGRSPLVRRSQCDRRVWHVELQARMQCAQAGKPFGHAREQRARNDVGVPPPPPG